MTNRNGAHLVFQCVEAGSLAAAGLLLPFDILAVLDGMLKYLSPWEVIRTYSYGFVIYLALGAVVGALLGCLIYAWSTVRGRDERTGGRASVWIHSVVFAFIVLVGTMKWLPGVGLHAFRDLLTRFGTPMIGIGVCLAVFPIAVGVAGWRDGVIGSNLLGLTKFAALAGLCASSTLLFHPGIVTAANNNPDRLKERTPRVFLITIDALAANHMSLYGYGISTTPELERLGKQSFVFERHHANGNFTTAGIDSILYGVRPWEHRAFQLLAEPVSDVIPSGLIQSLRQSGFETLAVSTNPWASPGRNGSASSLSRFSHASLGPVNTLLDQWPELAPLVTSCLTLRLLGSVLGRLIDDTPDRSSERALTLAKASLSGLPNRTSSLKQEAGPVFVWVHFYPPHAPYAPPPPFLGMFDSRQQARDGRSSNPPGLFEAGLSPQFPDAFVGRYDESVRYVDDSVGRFMDWLRGRQLFDDSLILVTADHGESFSHGYGQHTGPLLHEDLIHIPLLIKLPHQHEGKRIGVLTEQADLLPTVLEIVGLPVTGRTEGRSLRAFMEGKAALEGGEEAVHAVYSMNFEQNSKFTALQTGSVAMLEGRYKYVHYFGKIHYPHMPKLVDALYDLEADAGEVHDVSGWMPEVAARMRGAIEGQVAAHSVPKGGR